MNYTRLNTRYNDFSSGSATEPYLLPYTLDFLPGFKFYDYGYLSYDHRAYYQDHNSLDTYNPQLQQMLTLGKHTFLLGVDYFRAKGYYNYSDYLQILYRNFTYADETIVYDPFGNLVYEGPFWEPYTAPLTTRSLIPNLNQFGFPKWSYTFYLLDYWRVNSKLLVEWGATYKAAKTPNLRVDRSINCDLWSPRLGINYFITPNQVIRAGAYTALNNFNFQSSLMPSQVAGVPYGINAFEGSEVREAGASWEAQWTKKTFTALRAGAIRVSNPLINFTTDPIVYSTWREYYTNVGLNQILTPYLGLYLGATYKRFDSKERNDPDFSEINSLARLTFWHSSGVRAFLASTLIYQDPKNRRYDLFVLADAGLGYEFPQKRGLIFLTVTNIFDRHFSYVVEPIKLDLFNASRQVALKLALYF
jgi:hypothetical protein